MGVRDSKLAHSDPRRFKGSQTVSADCNVPSRRRYLSTFCLPRLALKQTAEETAEQALIARAWPETPG
jgi:hypothetical protein